MQKRFVSNAALCATIAQAILTQESESNCALQYLMDNRVHDFAQVGQQKGKTHSCGYAHDMLKNPQNQMCLEDWGNKPFTDPFFPY